MQPTLLTTPQPEPENKFPDCLYLKLEGIPVQPENEDEHQLWQTSSPIGQIDLYLTIYFNEQWESLRQGRVKFGLKGGELRLKLENSEIPYECRELAGSLELSPQKGSQHPQGSKDKKSVEVRVSAFYSSFNGSKIKTKANVSASLRQQRIEQLPVTICHVTTKVSEENPAWVFEEEIGEPVLRGSLNKVKLATLNVTALPCHVEATFEVS